MIKTSKDTKKTSKSQTNGWLIANLSFHEIETKNPQPKTPDS
jgi:hypothetical protein